jgi:hypothetical protein
MHFEAPLPHVIHVSLRRTATNDQRPFKVDSAQFRPRAACFREEGAAIRGAPDLSSLVPADDSLERHPPYLIDEVIVNRVASSEHSVDKRPIERINKGLNIEIG